MIRNIKGMCVGLSVAKAAEMHAALASSLNVLPPFVVTSFAQLANDIIPGINLIIYAIKDKSDVQHITQLQETHPGVALILYVDETNQSLLSYVLSNAWHGVCYDDDRHHERLVVSVLLALQIKSREIKSDIYFEIAKHLGDLTRFQDATCCILKRMCHLLQWQAGEIWALNDLLQHLTYAVGFSNSAQYAALDALNTLQHFRKKQGLPGFFYEYNEVAVINDVQSYLDERYFALLKENHFVSCIGVPIVFHQQLLGVMLFWSDHHVELEEPMISILRDIGTQFGEFIKKKRLQGDLLYLSQHDSLTHLANRTVLMNQLDHAVKLAERDHHMVALLYIDIDSFKEFNDLYGHIAGDGLLKSIADSLRTCVRETDTLARIGGDEFSLLLPGITDILNIELIAKKIIYALSHLDVTSYGDYNVTASIGVSLYPYHGNRFDTLLLYADKALYAAKNKGKNNYIIYPFNTVNHSREQSSVISALKKAIQYNEVKLYYQPIVEIQSNKIIGVESLLRWPLGPSGFNRPDIFIPLAEEAGLIDELGEWALRRATHDAMRIIALTQQPFKLVVNISAYQVTREFLSRLTAILQESKLQATMLTLELTETHLMDSSDYRLEILSSLRKMGIKLSIDDFGVGYSSFTYLNKFTVDAIKIDRSFTESMLTLASGRAIVSAILAVAHALDIQVIAEGVQNQEQLDFLSTHQCEFYQGHFFSEALPIEQLLLLLPTPSHSK